MPLVGASGAISGIAGAYVVLFPHNKFDLVFYFLYWRIKTVPSTAKIAVSVWFGEQLLLTAFSRWIPSSTAFAAHVSGFVFGAAVGAAFKMVVPREELELRQRVTPESGSLVKAAEQLDNAWSSVGAPVTLNLSGDGKDRNKPHRH